MFKWATINLMFMIAWLVLNNPIDHALDIQVGSAADWALYLIVLVIVSFGCSLAGERSNHEQRSE